MKIYDEKPFSFEPRQLSGIAMKEIADALRALRKAFKKHHLEPHRHTGGNTRATALETAHDVACRPFR